MYPLYVCISSKMACIKCQRIYIFIYMYIYICVCVCVYVCMCVCVCVCVCVRSTYMLVMSISCRRHVTETLARNVAIHCSQQTFKLFIASSLEPGVSRGAHRR